MPCRIGMTTKLAVRKQYWKNRHKREGKGEPRDWKILGRYTTKTAAQNAEKRLAALHGCRAFGGGDGDEYDNWVVYKFSYDSFSRE